MKRILLLTVVVGLFAGQASADMWEVDKATALGFLSSTMELGTTGGDFSVYDGPGSLFFGPGAGGSAIFGPMSGQVGFAATIAAHDVDGVAPFFGDARMKIYDPAPGLTGDVLYEGISMYVQNDNQSDWEFQLFYQIGGSEYTSPGFVDLPGMHTATVLTAPAPVGGLDLDSITQIGFRVQGIDMGGGDPEQPSFSDDFHASVVPVPAAVLLGFLGLGAAGLKLRRFA